MAPSSLAVVACVPRSLSLSVGEDVPVAEVGRTARIAVQELPVLFRRLAEGHRLLGDGHGPLVLEPADAVGTCADAFAHRQTAFGLVDIAPRVGQGRRLAIAVDVGAVEQ